MNMALHIFSIAAIQNHFIEHFCDLFLQTRVHNKLTEARPADRVKI